MIKYDKIRAHYLGHHKVQSFLSADKPHFTKTTISGGFDANTEGLLRPGMPSGSLSAKGTGSWNSGSVTELKEELSHLRAAAPKISRRLIKHSSTVNGATDYEAQAWYTIDNLRGHYALRHHDDFRLDEPGDIKPRIAVWLIEIPDDIPLNGHDKSVTWVIVTGTADQNHRSHQKGEALASTRAGSQTEELFEHLYASAYESTRVGRAGAFGAGFWRGNAAKELLGQYHTTPERIEALFECRKVLTDLHDEDHGPLVSNYDWSAASTNTEAIVSKIVLGTPLFVQRPRVTPFFNRSLTWVKSRF